MEETLVYKPKIVISGNFLEKIVYPDMSGFLRRPLSPILRDSDDADFHASESRRISFLRARSGLRRLLFANSWAFHASSGRQYPPVFLTLTYRDKVFDLGEANNEFQKFIQRLNYQESLDLKYVSVPEFQKTGRVHHHNILFNFPFVSLDRLRWIWGKGEQMNIQKLRSLRSAGNYLSKYLAKGGDDSRFFRKRRYSPSEGLFKPIVITDPLAVESIEKRLPPMPDPFLLKFGGSYTARLLEKPFRLLDFERPGFYARSRI